MGQRKFNLNDTFFDDLAEEAPAYWLGAMTADGYISLPNQIGLEVSSSDAGWLEKLKIYLNYGGDVKTYRKSKAGRGSAGDRSRIIFTSDPIFNRLCSLGFDTNKTESASFCKAVPEDSIRHYIRGLIDGDGSLCYSKAKRQWRISLRGTFDITRGFALFVNRDVGWVLKEPKQSGPTFRVEYEGNRIVRRICDLLYENCWVYLDRKKIQADEVY
jgi:hypothetical protein